VARPRLSTKAIMAQASRSSTSRCGLFITDLPGLTRQG